MQLIRGRYSSTPDDPSSLPLSLGNCGAYLSWKKNKRTLRPEGRRDWQLICLCGGRGFFRFGRSGDAPERELSAGTVVLYAPGERQDYRFREEDGVSFWWVHFSGTECARLLSELRGYGACFRVEGTGFFSDVCRRMLSEFRAPGGANETVLTGLLLLLIGECERSARRTGRLSDDKIREAVDRMNETVQAPMTVAAHAAACGLSPSRFSHRFKEATGFSPGEYMTRLAVEKAADLLTIGELNVGETADALGFSDPFYFCRVFRRIKGVPPSVYRKK